MKVILINSYNFGSTGRVCCAVQKYLNNTGDICLFAYGEGKASDELHYNYKISTKKKMTLHAIKTLICGLHGYYSKQDTKRLILWIKNEKPDIIHIHNLHGGYVNYITLLNAVGVLGIPVVFTLHDCWLYTGKCYHYYEANCDKWLKNCGNCPQLSMYPKSYFFDRTKKMLTDKKHTFEKLHDATITCVSDWLAGEARHSFLNKYEIVTIKNGIDTEIFKSVSNEWQSDGVEIRGKYVILGVASSWNSHKGLGDFIRLAKLLCEDEVIVLVGVTEEQAQKLPPNCIGIKNIGDKHQMAQMYNRADVFLNCSSEETFGMTAAEAMSCGTPVIVYNATACSELVGENCGYVVAPHDIDDIRKCIDKHKSIGSEAMRQSCRKNVLEHYAEQNMAKEYANLYRRIYESKKSTHEQ